MGNIIAPNQRWLPLPVYATVIVPLYPSWLNTTLAIWALLALLCCWFSIFLFLLRYCCRRWRQQQYAADRKSFHERLFRIDDMKDQHFSTAPLSLYGIDDFYSNERLHVREKVLRAGKTTSGIHSPANGLHSISVVSDKTTDDMTKNNIINETQNDYIQKDLSRNKYDIKHNQEIQTFSGSTIITINMAAERIIEDPNWEIANPIEEQHDENDDLLSNSNNDRSSLIKQATARIVANHLLSFEQNIKYEKQPNIYIYHPQIQENDKNPNKRMVIRNLLHLQNLMLSNTQSESNQIAEISEEEGTMTETIQTTFPPLEQQCENNTYFVPLPSSDIYTEEQPSVHYHHQN